MKSKAKALLALSLGIMCLTLAISTNQFECIQKIIESITDSATAGIPFP